MELKTNTTKFLASYLDAIGITGYSIKEQQDDLGYLVVLEVPKENKEKIGILRGKRNKNLLLLKKMLKIVGYTERKNVYLVIKLVGEEENK